MNWLSYLLAIGAGSANPAQAGANAQLGKALQDPIWATIWIYLSGLTGMLFALAVTRAAFPGAEALTRTPWWAWTGGIVSLASTLAGLTFAQKMGSGVFTGLTVTASIVTSILFDHFGLIGFQIHKATPLRLAGACLMVLGLWLVSKF